MKVVRWLLMGLGVLLLACIGLGMLGAALGYGTATPTAAGLRSGTPSVPGGTNTVPPPVAPVASQAPVTVNGSGIMTTAPFTLAAGAYRVTWTARPPANAPSCYHAADLMTDAGVRVQAAGTGSPANGQPLSGETFITTIPVGRYVVRASSGCDWAVTFTPG